MLVLKVKTGDDASTEDRQLMMHYRDDGNVNWSNQEIINLKQQGNTEFTIELQGMGVYKTRQYKFRVSSNIDFTFVGLEEEVELVD